MALELLPVLTGPRDHTAARRSDAEDTCKLRRVQLLGNGAATLDDEGARSAAAVYYTSGAAVRCGDLVQGVELKTEQIWRRCCGPQPASVVPPPAVIIGLLQWVPPLAGLPLGSGCRRKSGGRRGRGHLGRFKILLVCACALYCSFDSSTPTSHYSFTHCDTRILHIAVAKRTSTCTLLLTPRSTRQPCASVPVRMLRSTRVTKKSDTLRVYNLPT